MVTEATFIDYQQVVNKMILDNKRLTHPDFCQNSQLESTVE